MISLSNQDAYVIARAMARLSTEEHKCSPATRMLLDMFDMSNPDSFNRLSDVLRDRDWLQQVLAIDPKKPLESTKETKVFVPTLPKEARLSDEALKKAERVGGWLDDFSNWAGHNSPETPSSFIQAGGIWLIGLAIARRLYIHVHEKTYPHLYMLWIGESGMAKSTGLNQINRLVYQVMPYMLLPEENSPESLIENLAGNMPENLDKLPRTFQDRIQSGAKFAAQRGIVIDEAQSLLGANKKDYMQGLSEWLLKLYNGYDEYQRATRSRGMVFIRYAGLSIIGATTPSAMARAITADKWEDGELARYIMIYPESKMPPNPKVMWQAPPAKVVNVLRQLHKALPEPPDRLDDKYGDWNEKPATIDPEAYEAYARYSMAVRHTMPDSKMVELRLVPNYFRMHTHALKVALALAAIDWSCESDKPKNTPRITLGHWARAQQIVENWRSSLHHLLPALDTSEDARHQDRIVTTIKSNPDGLTKREIARSTGIPNKRITEALEVLIDAGEVEEQIIPTGGRSRTAYLPTELS